jgi:hypothetical protein
MTESLPMPQTEFNSLGKQMRANSVWKENGKIYDFEYSSQNISSAKRMKTRTEHWCQRLLNNKAIKGYEIIIRPQYRQNELWYGVYGRWTDEDKVE